LGGFDFDFDFDFGVKMTTIINVPPSNMCPICYSKAMTIPGPFGPHAGKLVCIKCGRWVRWVSKNEMEGKGKKESHRPR
jgi:hypothetical protein